VGIIDIVSETIYVFMVTVFLAGILLFFGVVFAVFSGVGMHVDFTIAKITAIVLFTTIAGALFLFILSEIYEMLREKN